MPSIPPVQKKRKEEKGKVIENIFGVLPEAIRASYTHLHLKKKREGEESRVVSMALPLVLPSF